MVQVIQCDNCNPPCTFPYKYGWQTPLRCPFESANDDDLNYTRKDIEIDDIIKMFE